MTLEPKIEDKQLLKQLLTKRASAKGQITKFRNYLATISSKTELNNIQITELNLKLAKFEALSVRVDDLQSEIEVLNSENISSEVDERDSIEQDIIINLATAKTLVERFSKKIECELRRKSVHNASCCVDDPQPHHLAIGLKLPQIQIAKFDGKHFRWLEFRDTFESLIHKNDRIEDVHKFHYLNSYLEGDAARIISNLEVSTNNYSEAWKLLCNRYDNKRVLINHHLNSLFNIKHLPNETERSLRFLVDHVTKNLRALSSLGQPTDKWDVLIIFMLSSKLDSQTLIKWEEYRNILEDIPSLENFYKFLTDRANVLESLGRNIKPENNNSRPQVKNSASSVKSFASTSKGSNNQNNRKPKIFSCIICNERHRIYDCPTFKAKGVDERLTDVRNYKLCKNCLRQGHPESECRIGPCREDGCGQRHNMLLHKPQSLAAHLATDEDDDDDSSGVIVNHTYQDTSQILLSTAIIEASNPVNQQKVTVRALLDCGSQSSFITESLKTRLSLKPYPIDCLKVIGIGNHPNNVVNESCTIRLKSINSKFNVMQQCLILNQLTGHLPKTPVNISSMKLPKGMQLADPKFHEPGPVDVLIGADLFWDILGNEQLSLGNNNPKLRSTQLGWIISGPIQSTKNVNKGIHCNHAIISQSDNENIDQMLTKFWDLEEVPQGSIMNEGENECEKHFRTHTKRDSTGRFFVRLPLKESADCLGDTYNLAKKRFISLEKRFKRNPSLKVEYSKFINEYAELGHLSLCNRNTLLGPTYHLCHHAVIREESESTKLRVVFDGSAPSTSGYSLNDILMVGPSVQDSLVSILLRARQHRYLLTGDVEKMYRQVGVDDDDRQLQLILWRENESQPIQTLALNTVTYGTASASYLSTRCLWQLGEEHDDVLIKSIIQKDFYCDDLLTGSDDPQQLIYIQKSVANALSAGGFNLRKYKTNYPSIFDHLDINKQDNLTISESTSTLGLGWTPSSDTLHFPVKGFSHGDDKIITKRFIMSNAFKIFDPLGVLSPVVVLPKIMLQKLWQHKLEWDQPVPQDIKNDWTKFANNVKWLSNLRIPRLALGDSPKSIELHSFSDASQSAYGACIYLRTISSNDNVTIRLLCAKSKVAPLKPTSIPRLELCSALVAAKLSKSVLDSLGYKPAKIIHWCDSSVVLSWIKGDASKLKIFVANRISEIKELTSFKAWRYVPTESNPADLISRGVDSKRLISMSLWWTGPDYLLKDESEWPVLNAKTLCSLPETKVNSLEIGQSIIDFNRYSSLNKLQRSVAYVRRFLYNAKNNNNRRVGSLSAEELRESLHLLCIIAQGQSYPVEYELLLKCKPLSNKSKILSLSPFLDKNKVIRVGGRIDASTCSYEKKHPILLHASHRLTRLYFEREHVNNMHAGPQLLLATVRENVWPVNGRHLARRTVNNCVRCRRLRGETLSPKMGSLPPQRLGTDYPFISVGIDFAGPFLIKNRKGRGCRLIKCYLCLFVCLRYKCVHLEAVSDLTKDAFIMTLRRFIARRGKPNEIFCDNGTNFVAAAKDVGSFIQQMQEPLSDFAGQQSIKFLFIPAYTPHFGGIWEAGVKSAKHHIKRVIGNSHLTFEEILTLFAQVEAILNSRPLCPLSSCPNDLLSLSPGHFIIGRPLTALPSPNLGDVKESRLHRYERLERIRQHFWQRWQKEYLSELQQRTKWRTNKANLNVGDMVLLAEDNAPPLSWRLGRVLRLITGSEGIARVADVTTSRGCVRRSLVRLCKLPTAEELQ